MTSVLSSSSPKPFLTDLLTEKNFQRGTTVGNQPAMHASHLNDNTKGHLNASAMHACIVDDDAKGPLTSATEHMLKRVSSPQK
jgi:hypothetical protein